MCSVQGRLQLTLAVLKPDVIARPNTAKEIKQIIIRNNFLFARSKRLHLQRADAERFYHEHRGRFFFSRLVSYMSSGPISAHILAKSDAISDWRTLMGPTKVFQTIYEAPNSIRGKYGLTDTRNATHGSDSEESVRREIAFFFPEFDIEQWYEEDELQFRKRRVNFNEEAYQHVIPEKDVWDR